MNMTEGGSKFLSPRKESVELFPLVQKKEIHKEAIPYLNL